MDGWVIVERYNNVKKRDNGLRKLLNIEGKKESKVERKGVGGCGSEK